MKMLDERHLRAQLSVTKTGKMIPLKRK
uniref:Uncharacterized protein n=1 Tax=Anguilla anguilla TaxID=7936 RepID=A0A0E9PR57_ANGAN